MDYTIYPFEGLGPIRFGMTSQQVHDCVGEPERSFTKSLLPTLNINLKKKLNHIY